MKLKVVLGTMLVVAGFSGCTTSKPEAMGNLNQELDPTTFYLPNLEAARLVTVSTNGTAAANVMVQTQRVAVKEGGPMRPPLRADDLTVPELLVPASRT